MDTSPKDILYEQINQITEPRILKELTSGSRKEIAVEILRGCIPKVAKLGGDPHENFGIFAESLTHYLLTNALIPSQRMTVVKNIEVDVSIPDSRTLGVTPADSLVLCFAKTSDQKSLLDSLAKTREVQPHIENILVVSYGQPKIPYKIYRIEDEASFGKLLDDIVWFLSTRPQNKFKIFRT